MSSRDEGLVAALVGPAVCAAGQVAGELPARIAT
jgi:hypothetical protein